MDQRRGLEGVTCIFPGHLASRQAVEFLIDDGGKLFQRGLIPVSPGAKQFGDVGRRSSIGGHRTHSGERGAHLSYASLPQLQPPSNGPSLEAFASSA